MNASYALTDAFALEPSENTNAPHWLARSWADPDWFYSGLIEHLAQNPATALKSRLGEEYDLYHDMVTRHLGHQRDAFVWHEQARGWQSASFEFLDQCCRERARSWFAHGVGTSSILCIVRSLDLAGVVDLLTGVRLGACISWLPPLGNAWLQRRIGNLNPEFIASEVRDAQRLGEFARLRLDDAKAPLGQHAAVMAELRSHSYASGEPCANLFSPLRAPLDKALSVTADTLYLGSLRDGLVTFSLGPGLRLAAPGFHSLQHQPSLLFSALMAGATYVEISPMAIERDPALLTQMSMRTVGVCNRVRDRLTTAKVGLGATWQHWFRNPEESLHWPAWDQFVNNCELSRTYVSNTLVEAATGGALLGSRRRTGSEYCAALMNVWPAPAKPWMLTEANGSGQEAVGETGILTPAEKEHPASHVVLAQVNAGEYLYGGTVDSRRAGQLYPSSEVLATLANAAEVDFATELSILPVLAGGRVTRYHFVLLVFTGDEAPEHTTTHEARRARIVDQVVRARMGDEFVPDRIDFLPRFARRGADGEVDHDWCRAQYLSGALYRSIREATYRPLTALRGAYRQATAQAMKSAAGESTAAHTNSSRTVKKNLGC